MDINSLKGKLLGRYVITDAKWATPARIDITMNHGEKVFEFTEKEAKALLHGEYTILNRLESLNKPVVEKNKPLILKPAVMSKVVDETEELEDNNEEDKE